MGNGQFSAEDVAQLESDVEDFTKGQGVLHTHEDGTTHRHFSKGFTIGSQVIADSDGTERHYHSSLNIVTGERGKGTGWVVVP